MSEELDADEVTALMADLRSGPADVFGPLVQATSQQLAVELLREHLMISAALAAVILDQPIKHLLPAAHGPVTQSADDADRFTNWTRRDIARIYGVPSDRVRAWARRTASPIQSAGRVRSTSTSPAMYAPGSTTNDRSTDRQRPGDRVAAYLIGLAGP